MDSAIHWINRYPLDNSIGFASVYPLDSDLSGGQRYPSFEQLGPEHPADVSPLPGHKVSCFPPVPAFVKMASLSTLDEKVSLT